MENNENWGEPLPETPPVVKRKLSPGQLAYQKAKAKKAQQAVVPEVTQAKAAMLRKQAKQQSKQTAKVKPLKGVEVTATVLEEVTSVAKPAMSATCSVCGKPLTRPASVSQGHGDICDAKVKLLPAGVTLADHYGNLTEAEVPEGFVLLKEAIAQARTKGCSGYRFIQACGGDRMLRPPFNEHFKVVFVQGKRYVSRLALQDLGLLVKV